MNRISVLFIYAAAFVGAASGSFLFLQYGLDRALAPIEDRLSPEEASAYKAVEEKWRSSGKGMMFCGKNKQYSVFPQPGGGGLMAEGPHDWPQGHQWRYINKKCEKQ